MNIALFTILFIVIIVECCFLLIVHHNGRQQLQKVRYQHELERIKLEKRYQFLENSISKHQETIEELQQEILSCENNFEGDKA